MDNFRKLTDITELYHEYDGYYVLSAYFFDRYSTDIAQSFPHNYEHNDPLVYNLYQLALEDGEVFFIDCMNGVKYIKERFIPTDNMVVFKGTPKVNDIPLPHLIDKEVYLPMGDEGTKPFTICDFYMERLKDSSINLFVDLLDNDNQRTICDISFLVENGEFRKSQNKKYIYGDLHEQGTLELKDLSSFVGYHAIIEMDVNSPDAYDVYMIEASDKENHVVLRSCAALHETAEINYNDSEIIEMLRFNCILFCNEPRIFKRALNELIGAKVALIEAEVDSEPLTREIKDFRYHFDTKSFMVSFTDPLLKPIEIEKFARDYGIIEYAVNYVGADTNEIHYPKNLGTATGNKNEAPNDVVSFHSDGTDELLEFLREDEEIYKKEKAKRSGNDTEASALQIRSLLNEAKSIIDMNDNLRLTVAESGVIDFDDITIELLKIQTF